MCMKKADPKASVCITNGYGKLGQCVIGVANGIGRNNGIPWSEMTFNGEPLTDVLKRENDALAESDAVNTMTTTVSHKTT